MIEFEQCVSLVFKPLLHHLRRIIATNNELAAVWVPLLAILEELLADGTAVSREDAKELTPDRLRTTLKELASEHLRNAIMVFHANGVLKSKAERAGDISAATWESVGRMSFCSARVDEWKEAVAANVPAETAE